jgi:hypothetical protein
MPDGEGGLMLTYTTLKSQSGVRPSESAIDPSPGSNLDMPLPMGGEPYIEENKTAVFWVDDAGLIYRYWFAPRVYRKGLASPPRSVPVNE